MKKQLLTFLAILISGVISAQVGIGTTTPTQALDIETNEAGGTAIDINNTGTGDPKINLQLNGTTTFSIGVDNDDADKLKIGTSAPETNTRVTIDNTGNVGIRTASPISPLNVMTLSNNENNGLILQGGDFAAGYASLFISGAGTDQKLFIRSKNNGGSQVSQFSDCANNSDIILNDQGGKVGIGTTSPIAGLDVRIASGSAAAAINLNTTNVSSVGHGPAITFGHTGSEIAARISSHAITTNSGHFLIETNNGSGLTERLRVQNNGYVGIGTTTPGYILSVNGRPGANGFTAFTNYSDSRLKKNISSLDTGVLYKILQLRPVSFQYNQKYLELYPNSNLQKVHKGFIAQEIRKVFPEMVSEMKASPDSVQYLDLDVSHLQVYLVKALQEQQAIINAQKSEIDAQKAEAMLQKSEIDALKVNALKVVELENKMNAMLLLLNKKTDVTAKQ